MDRFGCYTTARVRTGRIERLERHAGRLRRDAQRLALALPERTAVEAVALETVRRELGRGDGIVRIEWARRADGSFALDASTRPLGPERAIWRAAEAATVHPGPGEHRNAKALAVAAIESARAERDAAGVDEVLLYDAAGRLVEGSRTNLLVVTQGGALLTPARRLGAVEGLGLECAREALPRIRETEAIDRAGVRDASELIAINAVRGAVAIVALDGRAIGEGRAGAIARRLRGVFGAAEIGS